MSAAPPDEAIVTVIDAALGSLTAGVNLFPGPVRRPPPVGASPELAAYPHTAVFCLATGGPAPSTHVQNGTGPDIKFATVQVRIRSEPDTTADAFKNGQALARQVWTALQRATASGYISLTCRESEPVYLGEDASGHHEWSVNVATSREE